MKSSPYPPNASNRSFHTRRSDVANCSRPFAPALYRAGLYEACGTNDIPMLSATCGASSLNPISTYALRRSWLFCLAWQHVESSLTNGQAARKAVLMISAPQANKTSADAGGAGHAGITEHADHEETAANGRLLVDWPGGPRYSKSRQEVIRHRCARERARGRRFGAEPSVAPTNTPHSGRWKQASLAA